MSTPQHRLPGGKGYLRPSTGEILPGVTTLIKHLDGDPGALIGWATKTTAAEAVRTAQDWQALSTSGEAESLIKAEARKTQGIKRDLGTAVHQVIEDWLDLMLHDKDGATLRVHPKLQPYMETLGSFIEETGFTPLATEVTVVNSERGYAGTLDAVGQMGPRLVMIDWKTGRVRETMAAQLLLLQAADLVLHDDGSETPWLGAEDLLLVQIGPGDYSIHEVKASPSQVEDLLTGVLACHRVGRDLRSMITTRPAPTSRALT